MRQLQDDLLLETRKKAINLQLDKEFIRLLEKEISKRNLKISKTS
ncbi:sporulation histidine kinase inhibitor Sda [Bacillus dakarensis]|nr:sporulation histidine kinase inhibitor Sda [Bacillus dakarensis]